MMRLTLVSLPQLLLVSRLLCFLQEEPAPVYLNNYNYTLQQDAKFTVFAVR